MPEVTKRKVVARNTLVAGYDNEGKPVLAESSITDYVRPDFLDAYVADLRTKWQDVIVSDEPDAGPGGYEGATAVPAHLNHPLAGKYFPADDGGTVEGDVQIGGGGLVSNFLARSPFLAFQLGLGIAVLAMAAAIQTNTMKNFVVDAYRTNATHGALYTTAPGASQGTEVTGGSPAYARKALTWGAAAAGVASVTVTFDVASGVTVVGAGVHNSATVSTAYLDGASVTSQAFASQGTYQLTFTYTQT